jgi:hypothetical protein
MKKFTEYLAESELPVLVDLPEPTNDIANINGYKEYAIYKCPRCGGIAVDGKPPLGFRFKGSAECLQCKESFAAIHLPIIGNLKFD